MQANRHLIPGLSSDNTGSLGAESSACVCLRLLRRSHRSFSSQRERHGTYLKYSQASQDSPPPFFLPSSSYRPPSPPPLPVGKEKVGGGGGPAGHRQHCGILAPQLLPADGGQDAIGSAFCVMWCLSLSNSEQERQAAMPPGSASVRMGLKGATHWEGD